jgi:hypothetical protein
MGVWLLECDEREAHQFWSDWLQPEPNRYSAVIAQSIPRMQVKDVNDDHVLLFVQIKANGILNALSVISIAICLVICWYTTTNLFNILIYITRHFDDVYSLLLGLLVGLLYAMTIFSPFLILWYIEHQFVRYEIALIAEIMVSGIEVYPVTLASHWVFFPQDRITIPLGIVLVLALQAVPWLESAQLFVFLPLIIFIALNILRLYVIEYAFFKLADLFKTYDYWKLRAAELSGMVEAFAVPSIFYAILLIFQNVNINTALVYRNTHFAGINTEPVEKIAIALKMIQVSIGVPYIVNEGGIYFSPELSQNIVEGIKLQLASSLIFFTFITILLLLFAITSSIMRCRNWIFAWKELRYRAPRVKLESKLSVITTVSIFVIWLTSYLQIICGVAVIGVGLVWAFQGYNEVSPAIWIKPFILYQAGMEEVFGDTPGYYITHLCVLLILTPALLWILMYIYSFANSCWRFSKIALQDKQQHPYLKEKLQDLCKDINSPLPLIELDTTTVAWPDTTVFLPSPRFTVIRVPVALVAELSESQIAVVLAHELGHVFLHARKLWLTQLISMLSLVGPGYLTLLLDYWNMELEADAFAIRLTGAREDLQYVLEQEDIIPLRAKRLLRPEHSARTSIGSARLDRWRTQWPLVGHFVELYTFYFDPRAALWGYLRPSAQERIEHLQSLMITVLVHEPRPEKHRIEGKQHHGMPTLTSSAGNNEELGKTIFLAKKRLAFENANNLDDQSILRDAYTRIQGMRTELESLEETFDKFTINAKRVLLLAIEEARYLNHSYIGTQHLLLGIIREGEGTAAIILNSMELKYDVVRNAVVFMFGIGEDTQIKNYDLALTHKAQSALALAIEESNRLGYPYVGTEHLLLGLALLEDGGAVVVCDLCDLSIKKLYDYSSTLLKIEPL